jgi:hypothetical protein
LSAKLSAVLPGLVPGIHAVVRGGDEAKGSDSARRFVTVGAALVRIEANWTAWITGTRPVMMTALEPG